MLNLCAAENSAAHFYEIVTFSPSLDIFRKLSYNLQEYTLSKEFFI